MRFIRIYLILVCVSFGMTPTIAQDDSLTRVRQDQAVSLNQVEVRRSRLRYKKQSNPAYELAQYLVRNRQASEPAQDKPIHYTRHEKMSFALDNFQPIDSSNVLYSLNSNIVTNPFTGRPTLPISVREMIYNASRDGGAVRETKISASNVSIDPTLDMDMIDSYLEEAISPVDIFADYISFVQRRFVSPLSPAGLNFYRYYLNQTDTINIDNRACLRLVFYPINRSSISLSGAIYVATDSSRFVMRAEFYIPPASDVNYITDYNASIDYKADSSGKRLLCSEKTSFNFEIIKGVMPISILRENTYNNYRSQRQDTTIDEQQPRVAKISGDEMMRIERIKHTMRRRFLYRVGELVVEVAAQSYLRPWKTSPFDIGPIFNFISGNELEGTRLMVGAMTNTNLSKRFFLEGNVAYGIRDKRWKYSAAIEYSFLDKKEHMREFPVHSLRLSYFDDVHHFGIPFSDNESFNIFSWLQRASDRSLSYVRRAELTYNREHSFNLSYFLTARRYTESSSPVMSFTGGVHDFSMSELQLGLRYAPGEVIFQTKNRRRNMNAYVPIFELSHTYAIGGVLGSNYSTSKTDFNASGRINIQPLGYIDASLQAGGQWDPVPYMLLPHARTNLSYVVRKETFSMMRPLEFMFDQYVSWDLTYFADGLLLSRIPIIKLLKLREIVSFRGLVGRLTDKNNPTINTSLIPLPHHSSAIGSQPYMEIGAGVGNILNFFRLEYVWRLTYLDGLRSIRGGFVFGVSFRF